MDLIRLNSLDLSLAALLVLMVALLSWRGRLGVSRSLLVNAVRMTVQLLLIGLVLDVLFKFSALVWVALMALVMLLFAGREAVARQRRRLRGAWGYGLGTASMFLSSFAVTVLALTVMVQPEPWFQPQYAIPLLGMMLGNTMTGVALGLDRLTDSAYQERGVIEARLALGATWSSAIAPLRRQAMRSGLMPIVNSMAAAGIVSLPGMMTGQILAGAPPLEAVKYQILIMFLIAGGTGLGTMLAVWLGAKRLFDNRERLRLDRLAPARE